MGTAMYGAPHWREQLAQPMRALVLTINFKLNLFITKLLFNLPITINHTTHLNNFITKLLLAGAYPEPAAPLKQDEMSLTYNTLASVAGAFLTIFAWGSETLKTLPEQLIPTIKTQIKTQNNYQLKNI